MTKTFRKGELSGGQPELFGKADEFVWIGTVQKGRKKWSYYVVGVKNSKFPDLEEFNPSQRGWVKYAIGMAPHWARYAILIRKGQSAKWTVHNSYHSKDWALTKAKDTMIEKFNGWGDGTTLEIPEWESDVATAPAVPQDVQGATSDLITEARKAAKGQSVARMVKTIALLDGALTNQELLATAREELQQKLERMMEV